MKILHVVPTYYPAVRYGGPVQSVHGLASALAAYGHDVHVYTTNVDGPGVSRVPLDRPLRLDGVTISYFPTSLGRRVYRSSRMRQALQLNTGYFDLVHLHSVFLWPTLAAARAARRAGVPYVLSPRGMLVANLIRRRNWLAKQAWIALFERCNVEKAAAIHLTSDIEASELRALGFRCPRLAVVANGVELNDREMGVRKSGLMHPSRPYVLFLGRLNWKKGLDRLIPAMAEVADTDLLIAGNDEANYQSELKALAVECGLADRVRFLGPVHGAEKWELLSSAKLLALPSYSENFGNVVLEAMAVGCPVIVTPEVGIASIVNETGCGVVADGESTTIGLEMQRLLSDHERRQSMGRAGRLAVKTKYTWNIIGKQMADLYAEIIMGSQNHKAKDLRLLTNAL